MRLPGVTRPAKIDEDEQLFSTLDKAVREYSVLATGRAIPTDRPLQLSDLAIPITDDLIKRMATIGLATVVMHARRGSLKAAQILLDRALGAPEQTFAVRVQTMGLDECRLSLFEELTRGGMDNLEAMQLAAQMIEGETVDKA